MSAEPETTLAWAEFLWRVVREAPETAALYVALFLYWRQTQKPKGRDIHLELRDSISVADSMAVERKPAMLRLDPIRGTGGVSLTLTTGNDIRA